MREHVYRAGRCHFNYFCSLFYGMSYLCSLSPDVRYLEEILYGLEMLR